MFEYVSPVSTARYRQGMGAVSAMTWSVSRVREYEQCPRRFSEHYVHEQSQGNSPAFWRRGSVVHAGLEASMTLFADGRPPFPALAELNPGTLLGWYTEDAILSAFHEYHLDTDAPEMWDDCCAQVANTLEAITAPKPADVLGIEHEFLLDTPNGLHLRGFADVILRLSPSSILIRDYKTNSSPKSTRELSADLQLGTYAWCGRQEYGADTRVYASHFHTPISYENLVEVPTHASDAAVERIEAIAETAQRDDRFEPVPGEHCATCPFRPDCPVWTEESPRSALLHEALRL